MVRAFREAERARVFCPVGDRDDVFVSVSCALLCHLRISVSGGLGYEWVFCFGVWGYRAAERREARWGQGVVPRAAERREALKRPRNRSASQGMGLCRAAQRREALWSWGYAPEGCCRVL